MTIVTVKGLKKTYNGNTALNHIDFEIQKGEIFGFLGPSGSGKTTTINILTGQIAYDEGVAVLFDKPVHQLNGHDLGKIGIVSDTSGYYEKLSLYQNILLYAKIHAVPEENIDHLLKEVGLYEAKQTKAAKLSTGMRQRMLLVRALIHQPEIIFLDEPTSGLDPTTSRHIHTLLRKLKEAGSTIFLTTHDMEEASKLCDRIVLLHNGDIVEQGVPSDIIARHNTNQSIEISYADNQRESVLLAQFTYPIEGEREIVSLHTLEPTLEDVFITLTGETLNDN